MDLTGGMPAESTSRLSIRLQDDTWFGENHALWLWDEQRSAGHSSLPEDARAPRALRVAARDDQRPPADGTVLMSETDGPGADRPARPARREPRDALHRADSALELPLRRDRPADQRSADARGVCSATCRWCRWRSTVEGTMALPPALTGSVHPRRANRVGAPVLRRPPLRAVHPCRGTIDRRLASSSSPASGCARIASERAT